jgi:pyruvate kinase
LTIVTQVDLLQHRRTKIVATVGPASSDKEVLRSLINAGVNVFRLNMSHGDHDSHRDVYEKIRSLSSELKTPIAILADLCGPKIRTGKFKNGEITLVNNNKIIVTTRDVPGEDGLIPSQYRELANDVKQGDRILLNDGNMELEVNGISDSEIECCVIHGGILKNNKGINLPGVDVSAPSLTEKDIEDANFALDLGVDFLALSFVRRASDINDLKAMIVKNNASTQIVAKI